MALLLLVLARLNAALRPDERGESRGQTEVAIVERPRCKQGDVAQVDRHGQEWT